MRYRRRRRFPVASVLGATPEESTGAGFFGDRYFAARYMANRYFA